MCIILEIILVDVELFKEKYLYVIYLIIFASVRLFMVILQDESMVSIKFKLFKFKGNIFF